MIPNFTDKFKKDYELLDTGSQDDIEEAVDKFLSTYPYPSNSLRYKKMQGHKDIWEMSPNMDIRITVHFEKPNVVVFRRCGHHDKTLRNP